MTATDASRPPMAIHRPDADPLDADATVVERFEAIAERRRSHAALESPAWRATYGELNEIANGLARRLTALGLARGDRAAILMEHDTPQIAVLIGILKAGGIAVPLNPEEPAARLAMVVEDASPAAIVTDEPHLRLANDLAGASREVVVFDPARAAGSPDNPPDRCRPEDVASLIYTSGSTGRPKGVMYLHRQFLRNVAIRSQAMMYGGDDRVPLLASINAGQGAVETWCALLNGAALCPFPVRTRGVTGLAEWIVETEITTYTSAASVFRTLMRTIDDGFVFQRVRAVRLASEASTAADFREYRKHFPPTSFFVHTLASSETANIAWARWTPDHEFAEGILPVGRASRGTEISILGEDGEPVADGEEGEIVVRSRYVAAGYWNDPALTAERFSEPLDSEGTRLVRTGDLGRFNGDGLLEFRGRKDDRIKIRGNRIELADVERALALQPGIDNAAAVAVPRDNLEPLLAAFVVKTPHATWTASRLRLAVAANLPLHMLPSRIIFVDSLPCGPGGKVDRAALRLRATDTHDDRKGDPPRTEVETLVADIWAEIFELARVFREDDFFSLGGDSLRGALLAAQIDAALGIAVDLAAIAEHPTVAELASHLEARRAAGRTSEPPIVPVPRTGPAPLSLSQERIWKLCRTADNRAGFTLSRSFRVTGELDADIFRECLEYLVTRHEVLRTTFAEIDGRPVQIVHPSAPLAFARFDVSDAEDPVASAEAIVEEEITRTVDLASLPLFRHTLIRLGDCEHWLLRVFNPTITDGFGWQLLYAEHAALYEARLKGMPPPIPARPYLQFADYAVWQRRAMSPGEPLFDAAIDWWAKRVAAAGAGAEPPFAKAAGPGGRSPQDGVIQWSLRSHTAERLDRLARRLGATHFTIRLAAFAALLAEMSGDSTVVVGTNFVNRARAESRNIVGPFINLVPVVLICDCRATFSDWIGTVRGRVFETGKHGELPYEDLCEELRAVGIEPPQIRVIFSMASDHPDLRYGNITISNRFWRAARMPWGCSFSVDERRPELCRVDFDANLYEREGMLDLVDRYLGLLDSAARRPDLPLDALLGRGWPETA